MSRLLIKSEGPQGLALELRTGAYRIGRSSLSDFQIDHPSVSATHCEVILLSGSVLIRDLGSTNGTFIDRQRIQEGCLLFGQTLGVGHVDLMLEDPLRISAALDSFQKQETFRAGLGSSPGCGNHPETAASFACPRCDQLFCVSCVRNLSRMD